MSWNASADFCNWNGITCDDSTGDVIGVEGYKNQLNGTLPSWLFTLPSLEYLYLEYNMFSGNVPFESFALPSLNVLDLSYNQLAGHTNMQTFQKLSNLTDLYLSFNNFSGEWELDTLLSSLTNLEDLDLFYNGFSVTTNNANHYVNPRFRILRLASSKLKVFPNSFRAMRKLEELDLLSNEIHGQIPHWAGEIGDTYGLRYVNLSHNFITGLPQFQWFVGQLPAKYFQSFSSMKDVVKSNTTPEYIDMVGKYYSFVVAVKGDVYQEAHSSAHLALPLEGIQDSVGFHFPLPNHEHRSSPQVEDNGEDDDEEESGFTRKVVMLAYGCGTIIGMMQLDVLRYIAADFVAADML
ncbi:Leucine-rich repeat-containing protein [Artemisia annua]|uniref:Leucine-rich repeat-containing protein n=1 Tax=Artemisia annua TaxID=35608 RepID=A0A2U1LGK6_ARTAN|nr:Leucine-rich repeat-containing protein [Artemisia annua]